MLWLGRVGVHGVCRYKVYLLSNMPLVCAWMHSGGNGGEKGGGVVCSRGYVVSERPEGQLGPLTMTVQCSGRRPACQPGQQFTFVAYNRRRRYCVHQPIHLVVAPTQRNCLFHCNCNPYLFLLLSSNTFSEDHVLSLPTSDHLNSSHAKLPLIAIYTSRPTAYSIEGVGPTTCRHNVHHLELCSEGPAAAGPYAGPEPIRLRPQSFQSHPLPEPVSTPFLPASPLRNHRRAHHPSLECRAGWQVRLRLPLCRKATSLRVLHVLLHHSFELHVLRQYLDLYGIHRTNTWWWAQWQWLYFSTIFYSKGGAVT